MKRLTDRKVLELLRDGMPAAEEGKGPRRDLWPSVRRTIDQRASSPRAVDWLLVLALGMLCLLRPSLVGIVLLHF